MAKVEEENGLPQNMRLSPKDHELIKALQAKLGLEPLPISQVVRVVLRRYAEQLKIRVA